MNHRWANNTCINCGVTREKRQYRKLIQTLTKTVLPRYGVWEDRPVYQYGTGWWYGEVNKFIRPDCKKEK